NFKWWRRNINCGKRNPGKIVPGMPGAEQAKLQNDPAKTDERTMSAKFLAHIETEIDGLKSAGLYKSERVISSMQSAEIEVGGRKVLNFCANNYLGLADNEELREAAKETLDRYGYGMASVRFICGT